MKKGMNSIVFVWIFAAIAGAVILAFFFRFAVSQGGIMDAKNAREVVFSLEDKLLAFGISEESSKTIPINFENAFLFTCGNIENSGFSKKTDKVIFAPSQLNGKELLASIKEWSFPYPITKFYYLSNKQSRMMLIYDGNSMQYVTDLKMPEMFNLQKQSIGMFDPGKTQTESSTLDSLTLVFFTNVPNKDEIFSKIKIDDLNIVQVDVNSHQLKFFTRKDNYDDFYLGEEMLVGSFFAPENYKCLKEIAMKKLNIITRVNMNKATLLRAKAGQECSNQLYEMQKTLDAFRTGTINNMLYDYRDKIEEQNRNLKKNDCNEIW